MVFYWIVVFTGLRAAVMDYILMPIAKKGGVKKERDQTRFAEQAWLLVYYSVFWTLGVVSGLHSLHYQHVFSNQRSTY
jgi:acyl-CoA-dependent ceramide synthase